jgi:hypothetical protein
MPGIGGGADPDRRSQRFGAKAVLDPNRSRAVQTCCGAISVAGIPKVAGAEEVIKLDVIWRLRYGQHLALASSGRTAVDRAADQGGERRAQPNSWCPRITAAFKKRRRSNCCHEIACLQRCPGPHWANQKKGTANACKTRDRRRFAHFRYKRGGCIICRSHACHWRAIAHRKSPKGRCRLSCCWGGRPERRRCHATEGAANRSAQRGRS